MLIKEKIQQAIEILNETEIDCWITYSRETIEHCDPAMHFVAGQDVVWEAVFLIHRSGKTAAILGEGDHFDLVKSKLYDEVITYVQSIKDPLVEVLTRLDPKQIGINYSLDNVSADGLSFGLYQRLCNHLEGTDFVNRFVSAEPIFSRLRGRKTSEEIELIEKAALETLELFQLFSESITKGWTLQTISDYFHHLMDQRRLGAAWSYVSDPGISSGPTMQGGHATPDDTLVKPGDVLRLDFGIKKNGYCSDLQRTWYVLAPGESGAPGQVEEAFRVIRLGIEEAARAIKPGVVCFEVDAIARKVLKTHGYPEYNHALGHQVGIWAHDGGSVLAPRWERYGERPYDKVEENQVYTLEFGIQTSQGYVSQEDMVVVTADGCRFLAPCQKEIWLLDLE